MAADPTGLATRRGHPGDKSTRPRLAIHDEAPSLVTVCNWFNKFKTCRTNLSDDLFEERLLRRLPNTRSVLCGS
ncbi:hypothetical protein EVAR_38353_1 [Eumeta japonica]|uniref:Mos1 transposase HTH domain-containing protein n=1 Tax=Eumeta variegata TaxID=151549 RepID=A0A4C1Y0E9_EUMVA|nr:hypothetical protein EVAR_38353_1 [Eumeta japonica]